SHIFSIDPKNVYIHKHFRYNFVTLIWGRKKMIKKTLIASLIITLFAACALAEIEEWELPRPSQKLLDAYLTWEAPSEKIPYAPEKELERLRSRDPKERAAAATALGALKYRQAVKPLIVALEDEDEVVRKNAAWALGAIGDPQAVEPLIAALKDESVQASAAKALEKITGGKGPYTRGEVYLSYGFPGNVSFADVSKLNEWVTWINQQTGSNLSALGNVDCWDIYYQTSINDDFKTMADFRLGFFSQQKGDDNSSARFQFLNLSSHVIYDQPLNDFLHIYGGGGLGLSWSQIFLKKPNRITESYNTFFWFPSATIGLKLHLPSRISFFVDYTYMSANIPQFNGDDGPLKTPDGSQNVSIDFSGWAIKYGIGGPFFRPAEED
ncbi:MAG: HEAT repeat domain-containing protein, partial [Candidatus Margulisiibacteriota bacterium]